MVHVGPFQPSTQVAALGLCFYVFSTVDAFGCRRSGMHVRLRAVVVSCTPSLGGEV